MKQTFFLTAVLTLLALSAAGQTTKNIPVRHPVLTQDEITRIVAESAVAAAQIVETLESPASRLPPKTAESRGTRPSVALFFSMKRENISGMAMTKRVSALSKPSCMTRSRRAA